MQTQRISRSARLENEAALRCAAHRADDMAECPRTVRVLDAAWDRLGRELDEALRAGISDLIFTLGVYQAARYELTQEEADQAYLLLAGDLR